MRICCVAGTRPNFVKIGPIMRAFREHAGELRERFGNFEARLIHTGQHYDDSMSKVFFDQLEIPKPDVNLGVSAPTNPSSVAQTMLAFEKELERNPADLVIVVGDVNATSACAQVAAYAGIPVAHVEAGLRSRDLAMPEELNRMVTDRLSSLLLASCDDGVENLLREGTSPEATRLVGNVMIDTLAANVDKLKEIREALAVPHGDFGVVTLHRPSNVDSPEVFARILQVLNRVNARLPLILPAHPRTRRRIAEAGFENLVEDVNASDLGSVTPGHKLWVCDPLGYLEFQALMSSASLVVTDSGGLQEETTWLRIPCVTVRENTERPITITQGSNQLAGTDPKAIEAAIEAVLNGSFKPKAPPELWDGRAADRIVDEIIALPDEWFTTRY